MPAGAVRSKTLPLMRLICTDQAKVMPGVRLRVKKYIARSEGLVFSQYEAMEV